MARPRKQTADWFPHFSNEGGHTKFVLQSDFGNDGYAFWFKLLELLCRSDGHYFDSTLPGNMKYLIALAGVSGETVYAMLDTLAEMHNIDPDLWHLHEVIWCQKLVDNIASMYEKRTDGSPPKKPEFTESSEQKPAQPKQPETEEVTPPPSLQGANPARKNRTDPLNRKQRELFNRFWEIWPYKVSIGQAEKAWAKINPDEQLTNQIIEGVKRSIRYDKRFKDGYTPHPSTWLNSKGWEDNFEPRGEGNGFRPSTGFRRSADNGANS